MVHDLQFAKTLIKKEIRDASVLGLWLFPANAPLKQITIKEEEWANKLCENRAIEYKHARGYLRYALSSVFRVPPLEIPLNAAPGKIPTLQQGWGFISISHCDDALLIGWAQKKIGIDIERADRSFNATQVANRFFSKEDKESLEELTELKMRDSVLDLWVIKEAAIKWQRGKLAINLKEWIWDKEACLVIHKSLGYKLRIHQLPFKSWKISIAYDSKDEANQPVICIS